MILLTPFMNWFTELINWLLKDDTPFEFWLKGQWPPYFYASIIIAYSKFTIGRKLVLGHYILLDFLLFCLLVYAFSWPRKAPTPTLKIVSYHWVWHRIDLGINTNQPSGQYDQMLAKKTLFIHSKENCNTIPYKYDHPGFQIEKKIVSF